MLFLNYLNVDIRCHSTVSLYLEWAFGVRRNVSTEFGIFIYLPFDAVDIKTLRL